MPDLEKKHSARRLLPIALIILVGLAFVAAGMRHRILCHVNYPVFLDSVLVRLNVTRRSRCEVPLAVAPVDHNLNGTYDAFDIVAGARREVERRTRYDSTYYRGGYPPDGVGACTDVVWRALIEAGHDLKSLIDADIAANPSLYPRVDGRPDPNIDFRRVPNLVVFFTRHAQCLATTVVPHDLHNLTDWQPGDIVTFAAPMEHVGVVSTRRRTDGVPLVIHNAGPWASESDILTRWPTPITHHFRFPKPDHPD